MKKIILLTCLLASLLMGGVNAQSVTISGPGYVEVGEKSYFKGSFSYTDSKKIIVPKKWSWWATYHTSDGNGSPGKSGIKSFVGNSTGIPFDQQQPQSQIGELFTHSQSVTWGDWGDLCFDKIYVKVTYNEYRINPDNKKRELVKENAVVIDDHSVLIYCVTNPKITPQNNVTLPLQLCCIDTVEFCDESIGTQDTLEWKITGNGADNTVYGYDEQGQGKRCIKVAVRNTGDFTISAKAWRKTGHPDLIREDSIQVRRKQPQTSAITLDENSYKQAGKFGNETLVWTCKGETIEVCVDEICGMSGVSWDFGGAFDIISGQGTKCVKIKARETYSRDPGDGIGIGAIIPDGTYIRVSAQVLMSGGCAATSSSIRIPIFTGGRPPIPDGQVYAVVGADPCGDGKDTNYEFEYIGTPYINGFTIIRNTVSFDGWGRAEVTVCHINTCSRAIACKTYTVNLPEPCQDPFDNWWRGIDKDNLDGDESFIFDKEGAGLDIQIKQALKTQDIIVYPNPATNVININTNEALNAEIVLYDAQGKVFISSKLEKSKHTALEIPSQLANGVYFLSIQRENKTTVKKITIQR